MTAASTPTPRPRKKVATTRSRAVAAAVSALAFFGIGAAIGARATSVTTASGPVTTARADPAPATSWVWVRSSENDDEGAGTGGTWVATPGTTTVRPGTTTKAPTTTSGGSTRGGAVMAAFAEARFRAMGTEAHVIVVGADGGLLDLAERHVAWLEDRWSRFRAASDVSVMNALAGMPVRVEPETVLLLQRRRRLAGRDPRQGGVPGRGDRGSPAAGRSAPDAVVGNDRAARR